MSEKSASGQRIADNSASWPSLAAYFAPSAGCECQVLAMTLAEGIGTAKSTEATPAPAPQSKH